MRKFINCFFEDIDLNIDTEAHPTGGQRKKLRYFRPSETVESGVSLSIELQNYGRTSIGILPLIVYTVGIDSYADGIFCIQTEAIPGCWHPAQCNFSARPSLGERHGGAARQKCGGDFLLNLLKNSFVKRQAICYSRVTKKRMECLM